MHPVVVVVIAACTCWLTSLTFAADAAAPVAAGPRDQWLIHARAADAIGEVLMAASSRAEARVDELRHELGASADTHDAAATPAHASQAAYRQLLDQVVAEVRRSGAEQVDPSTENLPDGQLFAEMAALHSYNLRTVRRLGELRAQAADLQRRLEATGKWKGAQTTRPAIEPADALAREAIAALKRPERSPQWATARQKMRNAIATARSLQPRGATTSVPPPSSSYASPASGSGSGAGVDDPRWHPYYYGPGDQFGGWGDAQLLGDSFDFRGGGGIYERYDTRVNADYDTRTRGQSDRRVNVQHDRRLNIHVDPRQNF